MSNYTIEVNEENFAVKIFADFQEEAFIFQPEQPDGSAWASVEDATEWANATITMMTEAAAVPEGAVAAPAEEDTPTE